MMGSDDKVLVMYGESFFEASEEEATEYCESRVDDIQSRLDDLQKEEDEILAKQAQLKATLYGRFGKSINLD